MSASDDTGHDRPAMVLHHAGRDVLDFAEAVVAGFGEDHFRRAEPILDEMRQAIGLLQRSHVEPAPSIEFLKLSARQVEEILMPVGYSVGRSISRSLAELIPEIEPKLKRRDPTAMAVVDSHVGAMVLSIRKRLLAPSKPIAAGLLRNLSALREAVIDPEPEPETPRTFASPPPVLASEAEEEQRGGF